jgi:hypothetical protein
VSRPDVNYKYMMLCKLMKTYLISHLAWKSTVITACRSLAAAAHVNMHR